MPIRAVITDFGGVLYNPPDRRWMRRWQFWLRLGKDEFISSVLADPEGSEYVRKVYTGEIPEAEMWQRVGASWHVSSWMVNRMRRGGFSPKRYNREMAGFIQSLRPHYKTAILSNAGDQGRQIFGEAYHIEKLVDLVIISAEEKLAKPDERIYHLALERLNIQAAEAVFIDDLAVNVEASRRLGIHTVHFQNTAQAIGEVRRYLAQL